MQQPTIIPLVTTTALSNSRQTKLRVLSFSFFFIKPISQLLTATFSLSLSFHGVLHQLIVKRRQLSLLLFLEVQEKTTTTTTTSAATATGDEVPRSEEEAVGPVRRRNKRPFDQREALARNLRHGRGSCPGLRPSRPLHARLQGPNQLRLLRHAARLVRHLHYLTGRIAARHVSLLHCPSPNPNTDDDKPEQPPAAAAAAAAILLSGPVWRLPFFGRVVWRWLLRTRFGLWCCWWSRVSWQWATTFASKCFLHLLWAWGSYGLGLLWVLGAYYHTWVWFIDEWVLHGLRLEWVCAAQPTLWEHATGVGFRHRWLWSRFIICLFLLACYLRLLNHSQSSSVLFSFFLPLVLFLCWAKA